MGKEKIGKLKHVYFDGACPICSKEFRGYITGCEVAAIPVEFENLDKTPLPLEEYGLPTELARRYIKTADGRALSGVDAFISIWRTLPGYQWLANIAALPVIYSILSLFYDLLAAPLVSHWSQMLRRKRTHSLQSSKR